jgi:hypothetical protein
MYKIQLTGCAWVLLGQSLVLLLPILKLLHAPGIADWSWFGVLTPVWGPGAILAVIVAAERITGALKRVPVRYPKEAMAQELRNA